MRLRPWMLHGIGLVSEVYSAVSRRATPLNRDKMRDVCQSHWVCSAAELRKELGWAPTIMLPEGTRRAAASYRAESQL